MLAQRKHRLFRQKRITVLDKRVFDVGELFALFFAHQ